jgi:DNA-binding transcriptional LysR family regulator
MYAISKEPAMNIENIEAFVYVFHLGSFNKAAEALYLTQPSVSARIQTLERELNTKLFHREGKQISLTEEGKYFLPYAQTILQSYKEAKLHLQQNHVHPDELKIGCSLSVSTYLLPEILPVFKKQFPDVKIKVVTGHSHDISEKVLNREVDLGLVRTVTHPQIESFLFYTDPIALFVPPGHPFLEKEQVTIEEVSEQPLIFFDYASMDWLMIHRLFEPSRLQPNVVMEVDSMEAAKQLVIRGMGISFLPGLCVKEEVQNGTLVSVPILHLARIARKIDCIYLKGSPSSPFLSFFSENKGMYSS